MDLSSSNITSDLPIIPRSLDFDNQESVGSLAAQRSSFKVDDSVFHFGSTGDSSAKMRDHDSRGVINPNPHPEESTVASVIL